MNTKKGIGILGGFFILAVFILIWAVFLGGFLAEMGAIAISTNNLTGLEAFIWANLNFVVLLGVMAFGSAGLYFSGVAQ